MRRFRTQFDTLAYDDVVSFAIRAISPEYVDAMRALGVFAPAAQDVIDLGFAEITTAEVRALIASGHTDMSAASVRRALRHRPRRRYGTSPIPLSCEASK